RSSPNRCCKPSVALKTPPFRPTSSPRTQTRGSRSISSRSASRIAWTRLRSAIGIHVAGQGCRSGIGGRLRCLGGTLHFAADLLPYATVTLRGEPAAIDQGVSHPRDRIARRLRSELISIPVGTLIVVRGMRLQPQHIGLDERRPFTRSSTARRLSHDAIDLEEVITGNSHPGDAVGPCPLRDAWARDLQSLRHRNRPVIVFAEKDHRASMDRGEVHALVKVALARGALAEAHETQASLPSPFQRQADARRLRDLRAHGARADDHAAAPASEIPRRLPATA